MTEQAPIVVVDPRNALNERERRAYDQHMKAGEAPLSPVVQARFFASYMDGESLENIQRRNRSFQLGAIARAALEGDWEKLRREYLARLFSSVLERCGQKQAESLNFIGDLLSVAHKQHGDNLRLYLETGDAKHLEKTMTIGSIDAYRKVAEMLLRLSGQDAPKLPAPPEPSPARNPSDAKVVQAAPAQVASAGVGRPMLPAEAESVLTALRQVEEE